MSGERKQIRVTVSTPDFDFCTPEEMIESIRRHVKDYGAEFEELMFQTEDVPWSDRTALALTGLRWETDEELASRLAETARWERQCEENERKEFERLKAKFG